MAAWLVILSLAAPQSAAAKKLAKEVVESFGREALERAEPRVVRLVESLGDDAARALRRTGPAGVALLERHGAAGLRVLLRWGDDGLRVLALEGDQALAALARHGDDAMELMIRHPGVGRDLLGRFGRDVVRLKISTDSAVNLARLAEPIASTGRAAEILAVTERFGDRACAFLWKHKGVVFGAALLTAFLRDPEPYLNGVKELAAEPLGGLAREAASRTNWTLVILAVLGAGSLLLGLRWSLRPRRAGSGA